MPYRKVDNSLIWHWCHNCSGWPADHFRQREDRSALRTTAMMLVSTPSLWERDWHSSMRSFPYLRLAAPAAGVSVAYRLAARLRDSLQP